MQGIDEIKSKLRSFKRRYHLRQLVIGILSFLILNALVFLGFNGIEHQFWLGVTGRALLFFGYIILMLASLYSFIIQPILKIYQLRSGITDEQAAEEVSKYFPEIEDKLINTLQLGEQPANALLSAAIEKKSKDFRRFSFIQAVDFQVAKKYVLTLLLVATAFVLVSFINPSVITDSPNRIVNFKREFTPKAPFSFVIQNKSLEAFRGEDFTLKVMIEGSQLPESLEVIIDGKATGYDTPIAEGAFEYTFSKIQSNKRLQIEAAGFRSPTYVIEVNDRPDLVSMLIRIEEPEYTGGQRKTIENTGNMTILEGSSVLWEINTVATDSAKLILSEKELLFPRKNENSYAVLERINENQYYQINLFNQHSQNKSELSYTINVIEDQYPEILTEYFPDSIGYQNITVAGSISDDYGFSALKISYKKDGAKTFAQIPLEINKSAGNQSFYANWNLDTVDIKAGESLEMFVSVFDNDGVNGPKESRSRTFVLRVPTEDELDAMISDKQSGVQDQLEDTEERAEEIARRLEEIEERLKSEQKFDWQEKKLLDDVIKDREKLSEEIEKLKKQHEDLLKSTKQFQKQSSQLQEKSKKMQELLEELMDEETQKLYDKLKELMQENGSSDEISQEVENLKKSEQNLERDLERALELFKRLKMESALEQNLQKLDSLGKEQDVLSQRPVDQEAQEDINEAFDDFREQMDKVQEMNQELKRPEALDDFELEQRQIAKELRDISEEMKDSTQESSQDTENNDSSEKSDLSENSSDQSDPSNEPQQSSQQQQSDKQQSKSIQQKQKNAAKRMQNLSKKLNNMQGGMQMEMMQANLDQLRDILDNLVKLSFNQEEIMLEMREVNQSDPRFLELSQNQLKLKDDAKVIQDSLLSLASKVVQISSFITREVGSINENIDESIEYLKDRNRGRALSSQQFAMTSINNLALLLDDTMQQMQMAMSEAMGNSSQNQKQQSQGLPDLQEMQNQLGEQMNELKGSGKSGRELSEELARLAAEQEMIRRQLEMLKQAQDGKPGGGFGGDDLQKAIEMMEQNEVDLVNKRLTQQLINRQKQITTRMLEAEKAQRNQEMEEEREAQRPSVISREIPPGFEKYLELKKKEIELLKTIPVELNPFYKKEVNDYFRRLSSDKKND